MPGVTPTTGMPLRLKPNPGRIGKETQKHLGILDALKREFEGRKD